MIVSELAAPCRDGTANRLASLPAAVAAASSMSLITSSGDTIATGLYCAIQADRLLFAARQVAMRCYNLSTPSRCNNR
jgi:hypothetical protein